MVESPFPETIFILFLLKKKLEDRFLLNDPLGCFFKNFVMRRIEQADKFSSDSLMLYSSLAEFVQLGFTERITRSLYSREERKTFRHIFYK